MNQLETGDVIRDLVGSLGNPSEIDHYGNVIVIGGGCRVVVNNEVKFACVDRPEFDGHEDYLTTYKTCLPTFWS